MDIEVQPINMDSVHNSTGFVELRKILLTVKNIF